MDRRRAGVFLRNRPTIIEHGLSRRWRDQISPNSLLILVPRVELSLSRVPSTRAVPLLWDVTPARVLSSPPGFALVTTLRLVGAVAVLTAGDEIPLAGEATALTGTATRTSGAAAVAFVSMPAGTDRHDGPVAEDRYSCELARRPVRAGDGAPARAVPLLDERLIRWSMMVSPTAKMSLAEEPEMAARSPPKPEATSVQLVPLKFQMPPSPTVQTSVAEIASTAVSAMPVGRFAQRRPRRTVELQDLREIAFPDAADGEDVGARDRRIPPRDGFGGGR